MTTQIIFNRFGSLANVMGGVCVAIAYTLHPHHATAEVVAGSFWLTIHVLFALSLMAGVFGLFALFLRHLPKSKLTGLVGFILAAGTGIGYVSWIFPLLGIFFLLGYELFCFDLLTAGTIDRTALLLTMVGTLVFGIGLSGLLPMIVVQVGSILFGLGLLGLGVTSYRQHENPA